MTGMLTGRINAEDAEEEATAAEGAEESKKKKVRWGSHGDGCLSSLKLNTKRRQFRKSPR